MKLKLGIFIMNIESQYLFNRFFLELNLDTYFIMWWFTLVAYREKLTELKPCNYNKCQIYSLQATG